jgi:hypothetical protein
MTNLGGNSTTNSHNSHKVNNNNDTNITANIGDSGSNINRTTQSYAATESDLMLHVADQNEKLPPNVLVYYQVVRRNFMGPLPWKHFASQQPRLPQLLLGANATALAHCSTRPWQHIAPHCST